MGKDDKDANSEELVIWYTIENLVRQKGRAEEVTTYMDQRSSDLSLKSVNIPEAYDLSRIWRT